MFWIIWDILNSLKWWIYDSHGVQSPERHYNLQLRCHNCLKAPWHTLCRSECVVWGHYIAVVINEWFKSSSVSVHLLIYNKHNLTRHKMNSQTGPENPELFISTLFKAYLGLFVAKTTWNSVSRAISRLWYISEWNRTFSCVNQWFSAGFA